MPFRIGRKYASHTYPQSQAAQTLPLFARNFAQGPTSNQVVGTGGAAITPWTVESGSAANAHVPITPRVTGLVLVTAVIEMENTSGVSAEVQGQILLNDNPLPGTPPLSLTTVASGNFATLTVQALVGPLPVGVEANIGVGVITLGSGSPAVTLQADDSTVSVQEIPAATG
jgi:hypothetical protein